MILWMGRDVGVLEAVLGVELPVVQAPMAGAQGSALAIAVSEAGGLGSVPCAMLDAGGVRAEVAAVRAGTDRPFNLNFFCHTPPAPDAEREAAWRARLTPYYEEFGLDLARPGGPGRLPFDRVDGSGCSRSCVRRLSASISGCLRLSCSRA